MTECYQNEQFQIVEEDSGNQQASFVEKQEKSHSMSANKPKLINSRCRTIEGDHSIRNSLPRYSNSVSMYANHSVSTSPAQNASKKADAFGKVKKVGQFPEIKCINQQRNEDRYQNKMERTLKILNKANISRRKNARLFIAPLKKTYLQKVNQYFHHERDQLSKLSTDELNRLTNRIKQWIKKLDSELSNKISKAIILKQGKKGSQNDSQRITEILRAHISNNNQIIKNIEREQETLKGQSGELKEIQFELMIDKQLNRLHETIKQHKKSIVELKKIVKMDEGKLDFEEQSRKNKGIIDDLKRKIIQKRKQQERNIKLLEKEEDHQNQISKLLRKISSRHQYLFKNKNAMTNRLSLHQRQQQLRFNIDKIILSKSNYQSSFKRIAFNLNNQIKNIQKEIKQYQEDILHKEEKINVLRRQYLQKTKQRKADISHESFTQVQVASNLSSPFPKKGLVEQKYSQKLQSISQQEQRHQEYQKTEDLILHLAVQSSVIKSQEPRLENIISQRSVSHQEGMNDSIQQNNKSKMKLKILKWKEEAGKKQNTAISCANNQCWSKRAQFKKSRYKNELVI